MGVTFFASSHPAAQQLRARAINGAHAYSEKLGFSVKEILVVGRKNLSETALLDHLDIRSGTPIFAVDLDAAQAELSTLSWVEDVQVSRRLPDKIVVALQERVPAALWQHNKKIVLIDTAGTVIQDHDLTAYRALPLIVGEDAPAHVEDLTRLIAAEPALGNMLASAVRVSKRRWDLRLTNGMTIRLPETNIELALTRLISSARDQGLLDKNISVIDLRIPEKLTVTLDTDSNKTNI